MIAKCIFTSFLPNQPQYNCEARKCNLQNAPGNNLSIMHYLCIFCGLFSTVHLYYWVYRQIRNMQNAHFTLVRYDFTSVFICYYFVYKVYCLKANLIFYLKSSPAFSRSELEVEIFDFCNLAPVCLSYKTLLTFAFYLIIMQQ